MATQIDGQHNRLQTVTTSSVDQFQMTITSQLDKDTLPEDYIITTQNAGDDDAIDSDINETTGQSDTGNKYRFKYNNIEAVLFQHIVQVILSGMTQTQTAFRTLERQEFQM